MARPQNSRQTSYTCTSCGRSFKTSGGLTRHRNLQHRKLSPQDSESPSKSYTYRYHPFLTAKPCTADGETLPAHTRPPNVAATADVDPSDPWNPFGSRADFDFAYYHFVEAQSSEDKINKCLDMWAANILQYGGDVPWANAQDLYASIDAIKQGDAPWKVYEVRYSGPLPAGIPPKWMTETYELCIRDIRQVLHNQLATPDFRDSFDYSPYQQFDSEGKRVWSNLMSADWAWKQADIIAKDHPNARDAMFVPVISGSDKTTVSVATGHQEYHPVYTSPGSITNPARRAHGNGVLPSAFLPIPKTNKKYRKTAEFATFCRQMYHACLARLFQPLKAGMTTPEVVRCPDGHYRRAIYGLGPYIADYPEQVWLSCIIQNWCPKCDAKPEHLDADGAKPRSHQMTDLLVECFDPGILRTDFGIRSDVQPFTTGFPRADIHELLSPDLLHQVIKGTFKDHIVTWVNEYLHITYGEARANEIIDDIDRRIAVVPAFPGLRRFPDGRDFAQWTGDDSKALMKVYLPAIAGHVPSDMVKCLSAFLDFCYLARRNAFTSDTLTQLDDALARFHKYRQVFIDAGVREDVISLPRQHSLKHYVWSIILFGSPNGLCSSITESKHIKSVKEPWRRSSRFNALSQMLRTNCRLDKLAAARSIFAELGMMDGTTLSYTARMLRGEAPQPKATPTDDDDDEDDHGPVPGPKAMSSVELATKHERTYPRLISELAEHIGQPRLIELVQRFLYDQQNPDSPLSSADVPLDQCPYFSGRVYVYHSATARFYAPSDLCGAGGMHRERIRSNPCWRGEYARRDTVFVETDSDLPGMQGMNIGRVLLFFSFTFGDVEYPCALIHWLVPVGNEVDPDTSMWVVEPEYEGNGRRSLAVVHLDSVARAAHLIGVYGSQFIPDNIHFSHSLDVFRAFFVSRYADHHMHEFL